MIGECLDVLPDVLYYQRPAVNNLLVTDCVTSSVDFLLLLLYIFFLLLSKPSSGRLTTLVIIFQNITVFLIK